MKVPKAFIFFLIAIQVVLTLGHWALYKALVFFFPFFAAHAAATLIGLLILSVSFLLSSILDLKGRNEFFRWLYIIASVWLPAWLYLTLAAGLVLITSAVLPQANPNAIAICLFLLAVIAVLYGVGNARRIRITKLGLTLPNLPDYWKGKTAVVVSDLHLGHILRGTTAAKIVKTINGLKPDIVFIPGDFFDGIHSSFPTLTKNFCDLVSPHGIFFCSGNHELYAGMEECENALRYVGVRVLRDEKVDIQGLQIAGINYEHDRMPDLNERLSRLNLDTARASVLLKHVPAQMEEVERAGVSLMLSGHSHQGQVWPGNLITKKVWKGFDYGLKRFGRLQVYTSSGVGTWGPPVRISTKSEIVQITFN